MNLKQNQTVVTKNNKIRVPTTVTNVNNYYEKYNTTADSL